MKRVRAHLELWEKDDPTMKVVAASDWEGGTYPYIDFPIPHSFSHWFQYTDINYQTGDISLTGVSNRTLKSKERYILSDYKYRYNGFIDYEMYDDGQPYSEDTLEILINERHYDFTPNSKGSRGSKAYVLPYRKGVKLKSDILGYEFEVLAVRNEEIDIRINDKEHVVKMEISGRFGWEKAVCLGNTEDQVYPFGEDFVVRLLPKDRKIKE